MKIAICSPRTKPQPEFMTSLENLVSVMVAQGIETKIFSTNNVSPIVAARNQCVEKAMTWEPDYLFFVDDDMCFNNDIVEKLLSHKKDFVCALAFTKVPPFVPVIKKIQDGNIFSFNNYVDYPKNSFVEIAASGFGAVLIHRRLFEDLKISDGKWFEENKFFLEESEDINFCIRARQKGHKIWCDTSAKTRHIGGFGIGEENFEYWFKKMDCRLELFWVGGVD
jgi:GT2 family glycosyltransferase